MTEQVKDIIVVARTGFQVLLNIGNDCLTIDAFNPINLSEMYDEDILRNCGSLIAHLRDKNLIYYDGQDLPKDPNSKKIDALQQSAAQHIQAQFKQTSQDAAHPNMLLKTDSENVNENGEKTLQEQVTKYREQVEQENQKIRDKKAKKIHINTTVDSSQESLDPISSGPGMNKNQLNMKVSMDVDPQIFIEKQKANRKQLDDRNQEAEKKALDEIARLDNDDLAGGQQ